MLITTLKERKVTKEYENEEIKMKHFGINESWILFLSREQPFPLYIQEVFIRKRSAFLAYEEPPHHLISKSFNWLR